jgi:hypothetical protein
VIRKNVVESLIEKYFPDKEIGGFLWTKPITHIRKNRFDKDKISYVQNVYINKPDGQGRLNKDTYLPVWEQFEACFAEIIDINYLPVKFHTHATFDQKLGPISVFSKFQMETSMQERRASKIPKQTISSS